ncbi:MAG: UDP-4-amino-4,6-dideoxy-N-acetyl-beta-L-altrosamine transaminase [Gemmatimonadetes bacterium]|nr:MAG: UDP-4-amino-4,6-dideoxy-N-acetyl-beta-L-altrosamine transaminase [Gemmatimonadota bacterium]
MSLTRAPLRRTEFLPFAPPVIGEEEIQEVVDTLRSDWITTGPKTQRFETEFAAYLEAPGALALNSCTAGLHTALATLGVGPGDEVITTPLTFNIDPAAVLTAVTPRTRVILPVHYGGHPVDLDAIHDVARGVSATVIEDAAHALPARYKGRWIGSGQNPVSFSFYATKNMTTAEGGMLTGAPDFLERARVLSLHGMSRDAWKRYGKGGTWRYDVLAPGFKYNMTDIQAALGLCQLRKLAAFQERRREVVRAYADAFAADEALELPVERADVEHAWHLYVLRLVPGALRITRDRFIDELTARNIYTPDRFPVTLANFDRMLSLPLSAKLSDQDVADVIEAVLDVTRIYRR